MTKVTKMTLDQLRAKTNRYIVKGQTELAICESIQTVLDIVSKATSIEQAKDGVMAKLGNYIKPFSRYGIRVNGESDDIKRQTITITAPACEDTNSKKIVKRNMFIEVYNSLVNTHNMALEFAEYYENKKDRDAGYLNDLEVYYTRKLRNAKRRFKRAESNGLKYYTATFEEWWQITGHTLES